jgi:hypothetical protein
MSTRVRLTNLKGQITKKIKFISDSSIRETANEDRLWKLFAEVEDKITNLADLFQDFALEVDEKETRAILEEKKLTMAKVDKELNALGQNSHGPAIHHHYGKSSPTPIQAHL